MGKEQIGGIGFIFTASSLLWGGRGSMAFTLDFFGFFLMLLLFELCPDCAVGISLKTEPTQDNY